MLAEKMECLKEGMKDNNGLIPDIVSTKVELTLFDDEIDVC